MDVQPKIIEAAEDIYKVWKKYGDIKRQVIFFTRPMGKKSDPIKLKFVSPVIAKVNNVMPKITRRATVSQQHLDSNICKDLAKMLHAAKIIFPKEKETERLVHSIKRGLTGEEVVIIGTFCPDYTYVETGDPIIPYRYTFTDVNGGVGLVAQQFARVIPKLAKFLENHKIKHKIRLSIADFESNSPTILKRVNKSKEGFVDLCKQSLEAFRGTVPNIEMELCLLEQDWVNGRWNNVVNEARNKINNGIFGMIKFNTGKDPVKEIIYPIAHSARKFYFERYDREIDDEELIQIVINQGAEYAALGKIINSDFGHKPIIQIFGDHPMMQAFTYMYANHPTLSCKRVY